MRQWTWLLENTPSFVVMNPASTATGTSQTGVSIMSAAFCYRKVFSLFVTRFPHHSVPNYKHIGTQLVRLLNNIPNFALTLSSACLAAVLQLSLSAAWHSCCSPPVKPETQWHVKTDDWLWCPCSMMNPCCVICSVCMSASNKTNSLAGLLSVGTRWSSSFCKRKTHSCGELRLRDVGEEVSLCGWLQFHRFAFIVTLRDSHGVTQVMIPEKARWQQLIRLTETLKMLFLQCRAVLFIDRIKKRSNTWRRNLCFRSQGSSHKGLKAKQTLSVWFKSDRLNLLCWLVESDCCCLVLQRMPTGEIEIKADEINVLNTCRPDLPFQVHGHHQVRFCPYSLSTLVEGRIFVSSGLHFRVIARSMPWKSGCSMLCVLDREVWFVVVLGCGFGTHSILFVDLTLLRSWPE